MKRLFLKTIPFYRRNGLRLTFRRVVSLLFRDRKYVFSEIYKNNLWGCSESASGAGSSEFATRDIRAHLPIIFDRWKLKNIVDAPCGDFNLFKFVTLNSDMRYIGIDIVPDLIANNNIKYTDLQHRFVLADIRVDSLPTSDIVICRDCLFHFSYKDVFLFLSNFVASETRFLLTSTHKNEDEFPNTDILTGEFRLIDLFSAPFSLPPDVAYRFDDFIPPYPAREMCLWNRAQIIMALAAAPGGRWHNALPGRRRTTHESCRSGQ